MTKTIHIILSVDENSSVPESLKVKGDCKYNIEIENGFLFVGNRLVILCISNRKDDSI